MFVALVLSTAVLFSSGIATAGLLKPFQPPAPEKMIKKQPKEKKKKKEAKKAEREQCRCERKACRQSR
jgi:hypothetical protein